MIHAPFGFIHFCVLYVHYTSVHVCTSMRVHATERVYARLHASACVSMCVPSKVTPKVIQTGSPGSAPAGDGVNPMDSCEVVA